MNKLQISDYSILDHLLEGCEIIGFDFRYLYVNNAAAKQERKSRNELLGRTMLEINPNVEDTLMFYHLKQCMNERMPDEFESEFPSPDGTTTRFKIKIEPMPQGAFVRLVDISSQNRAEQMERRASVNIRSDHAQYSGADSTFTYDKSTKGWSKGLEFEGWTESLGLRNKETEEHILRVAEMTVTLARMAGIPENEIVHVRRGALLHDIGNTGVPDAILRKPDKLTDDEWVIIHKHPIYAYDLLFPIEYLRPCLPIPHSHHEKWDGTGYPQGLKGEEIPLAARLFAVADTWDKLSSNSAYREAWSQDKIMQYIRQQAKTHFDINAVELFMCAYNN